MWVFLGKDRKRGEQASDTITSPNTLQGVSGQGGVEFVPGLWGA